MCRHQLEQTASSQMDFPRCRIRAAVVMEIPSPARDGRLRIGFEIIFPDSFPEVLQRSCTFRT